MPYRTFTSPGGQLVNGVIYIYQHDLVVGDVTGNFRPAMDSDFAPEIIVSGISVDISGIEVNTQQLEDIGGTGNQYLAAISGRQYSTVSNNFAVITTAQQIIPARARSWAFAVVSGAAYVDGAGPILAGYTLSSQNQTTNPVVIGCTGGNTVIQWET